MKKHLSTIANHLLQTCAETLGTSVDALIEEFEVGLKPGDSDYSRKLVEFCSSKALSNVCCHIDEKIGDGSFSRFTFDMMLAWESPSSADDDSYVESIAKEREDRKVPPKVHENDDIPLFYSDIMPLLVDHERSVGDDAFVWLGSLVPLVVDVVNARFAFGTITAPTANRLYFPAYDKYLNEITKCINYLQKQATPTGVELAEDEFILHVEGTANTQRVVRHIGVTSWPGRLTLTNYALYFEASGVISYEDAIKIDLSRKDVDHKVRPTATGPWGAPIFDKAIIYESSQLSESMILEFPELTSSTRRDHWLTLVKEIILLHQFLSKFKVESPLQAWEMQARTTLGIIRLHAVREMLRISTPVPSNFLIFSLFDELPKGDYVLEEISNGLKQMDTVHPCSTTSILKSLNMSHPSVSTIEQKEPCEETSAGPSENLTSLETSINQVREEAKEVDIAKASVEEIKEEGIADSVLILSELLSPLTDALQWPQGILTWERPGFSVSVLFLIIIVIYKEWIGYVLAAVLVYCVAKMLRARHERVKDRSTEIVVCTSSDQTTMESIVNAQHRLKCCHEMLQTANIAILKIQSIFLSRAPKHTDQVISSMIGISLLLLVVPFKFIIIGTILHYFIMNSKLGKYLSNEQGARRLREWWDSIPVVPVRTVDKTS